MQNKPKLRKSQMNVNKVLTKDYEKKTLSERGKNKPKTNPNKPKQSQTKANFLLRSPPHTRHPLDHQRTPRSRGYEQKILHQNSHFAD